MLTAGINTVITNDNTSSTGEQKANNDEESRGGHEKVPEKSDNDSASKKGRGSWRKVLVRLVLLANSLVPYSDLESLPYKDPAKTTTTL